MLIVQNTVSFCGCGGRVSESLATKTPNKEWLDNEHGAAGTYHQLGRIAQVQRDFAAAEQCRTALSQMEEHGWTKLVAAIRKILSGERNKESLCQELDAEDSMIVETILQALEDPSILETLLPDDESSE